MFSFFTKQKPAIGLDISDSSVRMMQLSPSANGLFPNTYSQVILPRGVVSDGEIKGAEKLAESIKQAYNRPLSGHFDTTYAILSVPESKSFVRVISVPRMSQEEAREAVPYEAEQYIPITNEQAYLDFRILPDKANKDEDSDKMRVLITATPHALIDQYVSSVKNAGLRPLAVEVESEAIARCLVEESLLQQPVLTIDISSSRTSIIIHDLGSLQFTSSLPVAGNTFTTRISQCLTISMEEAEKYKIQAGLDPRKDQGKLRDCLAPQVQSLVEAISNAINFYKEHSEGSRQVSRVFLTGGGSRIRGLDQFISQLLSVGTDNKKISVSEGDPWINVLGKPVKRVPPIPKGDSISFTTAIGLALRGADIE